METELGQGDLEHQVKEVVVEFEELLVGLDLIEGIVEDTQDEEDARKTYPQKDSLTMSFVGFLKAMASMMFEGSKIEDMYDKA